MVGGGVVFSEIIRPLTAEGRCRYHGVTERDLGQTVVLALGVISAVFAMMLRGRAVSINRSGRSVLFGCSGRG